MPEESAADLVIRRPLEARGTSSESPIHCRGVSLVLPPLTLPPHASITAAWIWILALKRRYVLPLRIPTVVAITHGTE